MISSATLKKYKLDSTSLEKLFIAKKPSDDIKRLTELLAGRNRDGIERCLTTHRTAAVADLAYDAPSNQETPTIIRYILSSCGDDKQIGLACESWGIPLNDLFCKSGEKDSKGNDILALDPPVFDEVDLPVVRSYVTVRAAKIFNDRNSTPLHKYEPPNYTAENRIRCEIVTNLIEQKSAQFGYASTMRQQIFQTLHYSDCMMFPLEPWYEEKQEGEDGKPTTVRAGVRYILPHKTRYWYDMSHPFATFNTDTGCSSAGYFSIQKWGEVDRNKDYWNRDKVGYGTNWLNDSMPYHNYFRMAYPCTLKFPVWSQTTSTDRETIADRYTSADYDKAVFLGYQFAKLVPKDWGLGDYKYPVWFRFIMAGADTILWAEPFAYRPITVGQYDADQNRGKNASMTADVLPFQTLMGNLITQLLLTIKRNLSHILFYDQTQIYGAALDSLKNSRHKQYSSTNFIGFDGLKDRLATRDSRAAVHQVAYAYADTSQLIGAFNVVVSMLERHLVISPQEIGAAASHQQSVREIVTITANTTNRSAYTASFTDETNDAWKRQLYEAEQAYGDDEIISEVSGDIPDVEKHLKKMGFEVTGKLENGKKIQVKGKKNALRMESFASRRSGPERNNDMGTAQAMMQAIMSLNQNQMAAAIADPQSVLELLEQAAKFAGADKDFKIRINKDALKGQQLQQAIGEIQKMLMQTVEEQVAKPAAHAISEQKQKINAHKQELDRLMLAVAKLQDMALAAQSAPPLQPPNVTDLNANQAIVAPVEQAGISEGLAAAPAV